MGECEICGKNEVWSFTCNYCGGVHCKRHRLPENHGCSTIPRNIFGYARLR